MHFYGSLLVNHTAIWLYSFIIKQTYYSDLNAKTVGLCFRLQRNSKPSDEIAALVLLANCVTPTFKTKNVGHLSLSAARNIMFW